MEGKGENEGRDERTRESEGEELGRVELPQYFKQSDTSDFAKLVNSDKQCYKRQR